MKAVIAVQIEFDDSEVDQTNIHEVLKVGDNLTSPLIKEAKVVSIQYFQMKAGQNSRKR